MNILDIIFPPSCGFCGKISSSYLCIECETKIAHKLEYKIEKKRGKNFETHIYIMNYEGEMRNKILSYKFKNKSYMYKTFAKIILNNKKICNILKTYDIITSVPLHKKRQNERGYNQSELIAKEIAKNIKEITYLKLLKKIKNTPKQSSLKSKEREENVKDVYQFINKQIINKGIILFDDIYTTGSTANECSKVLKQNGARRILILSLAK